MPHNVVFGQGVATLIREWPISTELRHALQAHLRVELGTRPTYEIGQNINAPVRCFIYRCSLRDPMSGIPNHFIFYVNETQKPGTRLVIDAKWRLDC